MSVPAQTPYKKYTAAPAATLFTTNFRLLLASDLVVKVNGAPVTTGFTVSGIGAAIADVTFGTPMVGGEIIELQRSVPKTRDTDFQQLGDFQAPMINADLDRIVMMLQDSQFLSNLAVSLPSGDAAAPMTLPALAARASMFFAFDALGNAIAAAGASGVPVSTFIATLMDDLNAAAARATLGAAASGPNNDITSVSALTAINGGPIAGFRNHIHNGGFQVDQRNAYAAQTITAGAALAYTADRWYAFCTGANVTGQVVAGSAQAQRRYRFTGAASVTAIGFGTRLEARDTYDLNSQTVTIAADLANSLLTTVTWTLFRATTTDDTFGTLAAPTVTQIATGTFTVNSTVSRYSAQVSVPPAATTGLQLVFSVGAQTSGTWTIGNVQLEPGAVATVFENRPYATELAMCQRYYYQVGPSVGTTPRLGVGFAYSATLATVDHKFPVEMRVSPTVFTNNGVAGNYGVDASVGGGTCSVLPNNGSATTKTSAEILLTRSGGMTAGQGVAGFCFAGGAFLGWGADL